MIHAVGRERDTSSVDAELHEAVAHDRGGGEEPADLVTDRPHVGEAALQLLIFASVPTKLRSDRRRRRPERVRQPGQPQRHRPNRTRAQKSGPARAARHAKAAAAAAVFRAITDSVLLVEKLAAMTDQPVVVKREQAWDPACGQ